MRVVGYYNSFSRQDVLNKIFLAPITHINYAFLLPKEDGSVFFYDEENAREVVTFAHENGRKVFVSIGGAIYQEKSISKVFEKICEDEGRFTKFLDSIVSVTCAFDFDGVDLDWEYPTKDYINSFEEMISTLYRALHQLGKELTIAVHRAIVGEAKDNRIIAITDKVISNVDWLNIMTYDASEDDNHSSLIRCIRCLNYWHKLACGTILMLKIVQLVWNFDDICLLRE